MPSLLSFSPSSDCFDILLNLASFELVKLRCNNDRLIAIIQNPVIHHLVICRRIMTDINKKKNRLQVLWMYEDIFRSSCPIFPSQTVKPLRIRNQGGLPDTWLH